MGAIFVSETDPTLEDFIETALPNYKLICQPGLLDVATIKSPEEIEGLCVTVRSPVNGADMDAMPNLKIITTGSTGFDHIDVKEAVARDITVCNVARYGPAVAEFNIAQMLALTRKVHTAYMQTLQNDFTISGLKGRNLSGKVLGIIGTGNIGLHVGKLAKAFGMLVIATDPYPMPDADLEYVTLDELVRRSEIIAICCPLLLETHHMIGRAEFEKMRHGVLIVNTSRGAVMDTQALVWALDQGIVAGAALDVLEGEVLLPSARLTSVLGGAPGQDDVKTIAEDLTLIRHPRVLVTPHIAFFTVDSIDAIWRQTAENLKTYFEGNPTNAVAAPIRQSVQP